MPFSEDQVLFLDVDNAYGADELGLPYRDLISEGVVGDADMIVSQNANGANMSVDVAAGACWVKGDDDAELQPTYRYREPATTNVAITTADATNPRVDLVIAEVLDSTFSGTSKLGQIRAVDGTPTSGADATNLDGAAALPNNAVLLAYVLVPGAALTIVDANISDRRIRAQVGGGAAFGGARPVVASTVDDLNAAFGGTPPDGAQGILRPASSAGHPAPSLHVTYFADPGQWESDEAPTTHIGGTSTPNGWGTSSTTFADADWNAGTQGSQVITNEWVDASWRSQGMTPQFRWTGRLFPNNVSHQATAQIAVKGGDPFATESASYVISGSTVQTIVGTTATDGSNGLVYSPWCDFADGFGDTPPANGFLLPIFQAKIDNGSYRAILHSATIYVRWVSA